MKESAFTAYKNLATPVQDASLTPAWSPDGSSPERNKAFHDVAPDHCFAALETNFQRKQAAFFRRHLGLEAGE